MAGGGGNAESGEPEFQIAPMIDVLLVLLIFFMSITSAQVLRIDKDIKLPVAADAKKKEDKNQMFEAALNIRWIPTQQKSVIKLDTAELENEEIVNILTERKNNNPTYRAIIRADRDVLYGDFMAVMNTLQGNGFYQVALINEEI